MSLGSSLMLQQTRKAAGDILLIASRRLDNALGLAGNGAESIGLQLVTPLPPLGRPFGTFAESLEFEIYSIQVTTASPAALASI
jgi:hypothetical protein